MPTARFKINPNNISHLVDKGKEESRNNKSVETGYQQQKKKSKWNASGGKEATVVTPDSKFRRSSSNSNNDYATKDESTDSFGIIDTKSKNNRHSITNREIEEKQHRMSHGNTPSNNAHGENNNSATDNDSVMTSGTFMVMARPDGTRSCVKHPHLSLDGWACPECEKGFKEAGNALMERQANVDSRLKELEGQQQIQHSNLATDQQQPQMPFMSAAPNMVPYMQQGPYGNPMANMNAMHTVSARFQNMSMNGGNSSAPAPNNSTSLETLALQINRMQQMQDWMLLQKEREISMLRQELGEAQQKLHATQVENAVLQEKLMQQNLQHEQEMKLVQLTMNQANNGNLCSPNKNTDYDDHGTPASSKDIRFDPNIVDNSGSKTGSNSQSNTNPHSKSTNTSSTTIHINSSLKPPPPSSSTSGIHDATNGSPKTAPKANTPVKNAPSQKAPPNAFVAEAKKGPTNASKLSSTPPSGERTRSAPTPKAPPASNNRKAGSNQPPSVLNNKGMMNTNEVPSDIGYDTEIPSVVPLNEEITMGTIGKNLSWRAGMLEARAAQSDRFEPKYIGTVDDSDGNGRASSGKDIQEFPMEEDKEQSFLPSNDQQSLTVASSTYGEDRQKVTNQSLLDPYGDKGIYTGLILKSTGMPHGSGRMVYEEDQRVYEGEWRHGRWHGFGEAKFANGDAYEGGYRFDQRHGHGKYSWADGRSYDGEFSEDRRHGKGLFLWPDGAIYDGEFANGQREGHGTYKFSDGGEYIGSWKDGRYNGFGTCTWEDGRCYRGEWRNGMAHGKGIETFADGTVRHDGQWIEDTPVTN